FLDSVCVIEQHAEVANSPDARVEAGRRLSGFEAGKAQDALLRFAGGPVEICLLVRARGYTRAPTPAALLVNQHDPVFSAFIECARWARRHTSRIQTVIANSREVEEHQALGSKELFALLGCQT